MGFAALVVGGLIALAIAVAIVYGIFVGLARFARFLWHLLVGPEAQAEVAGGHGEEIAGQPCWEEKDCPQTVRETCPSYLQKDGLPCWLANMKAEGRLRVDCLTCRRFNLADLLVA